MHIFRVTIFSLLVIPSVCFGQVVISEIMYDVSGTDTGREWIELQNTGSSAVDLASWKLVEASTNHSMTQSQGATILSPGSFIIVADDPIKFKTDWPNFAGAILNSTFSLANEGETLTLKNGNVVVDQVSYTSSMGAMGDGKSLARVNGGFVSATPTPGSANRVSTLASPVVATSGSADTSATTSSTGSSNTSAKIYVDAGQDTSGVVGASILFSGKAYGLKKEPLINARLIWNFGDGSTAEGVSVLHTYGLPGTYTVFLDVASGVYSATDKLVVTVVPATLNITRVLSGSAGYVTIANGSDVDLDISRWYLRDGSAMFLLPAHTIVSAHGALTIPNSVSALFVTNTQAELLYPNGEVEYRFAPPTVSQSPTKSPAVATKPAVAKKVTPVVETRTSQVASVGVSGGVTPDGHSEVLSVSRKSDSVALWMLGLSGFVAVIFGGMWFAHRKSVVEQSESVDSEDEDEGEEFEIIH
ncbi:MAG: hypothetical protein RLZZ347_786 [Candidatus Parcubacteria bacterium]|jgi:hypothetical protein